MLSGDSLCLRSCHAERAEATPPPSPVKLTYVILAILLIAAAAYLLWSIPIGYLLVRFFRHEDIRSVGSGNIGATNVLRSGTIWLDVGTLQKKGQILQCIHPETQRHIRRVLL